MSRKRDFAKRWRLKPRVPRIDFSARLQKAERDFPPLFRFFYLSLVSFSQVFGLAYGESAAANTRLHDFISSTTFRICIPNYDSANMTQPTSVNQTFDTSLIDLQATPKLSGDEDKDMTGASAATSFSSTSTVPSDGETTLPFLLSNLSPNPSKKPPDMPYYGEPTSPPTATHAPGAAPAQAQVGSTIARGMPVHYLPTVSAYDAWADVYDSDGNVLQAVDDLELASLLPTFIDRVLDSTPTTPSVIDIGCGTGRNTAKLAAHSWRGRGARIAGVDASGGMLGVAANKIEGVRMADGVSVRLVQHDFLNASDAFAAPVMPAPEKLQAGTADAVVSTLVLEHMPLRPFFSSLAALLRRDGLALVTNMHADMGNVSQAGFERVDPDTGKVTKVRGCSWAHTVGDSVRVAEECGLEMLAMENGWERGWKETAVSREMVDAGQVSQRGEKWIGRQVWYGMVMRKR